MIKVALISIRFFLRFNSRDIGVVGLRKRGPFLIYKLLVQGDLTSAQLLIVLRGLVLKAGWLFGWALFLNRSILSRQGALNVLSFVTTLLELPLADG